MAITAISIPWLRAACSTRNGKASVTGDQSPARLIGNAGGHGKYAGLFHDAALGSFDKFDQLANIVRVGKIAAQRGKRLRGIELGSQQSAKARCKVLTRSGEKPRRSSPMEFAPKDLVSRSVTMRENGGTSWVMTVEAPT